MAYAGSTASTPNPPLIAVPRMGTGVAIWLYNSTHSSTDVFQTSRFITDGYYIGMKAGDLVISVGGSSLGASVVSSVTTLGTTFIATNLLST